METEINILEAFLQINIEFTKELEKCFSNPPIGACYLLGHCLAKGLYHIGFNAFETTGELIIKGSKNKNIVYGSNEHKGLNVGAYHTWCTVNFVGNDYILDPSIKYNKVGLKQDFNIELNIEIPNVVVTYENKTSLFTYIENKKLIPLSKNYLKTVDPKIIHHLVCKIEDIVKIAFQLN